MEVTENAKVRQIAYGKLEADGTLATNTKIEVLSGNSILDGYGELLDFAGGYIDFGVDVASDIDYRIFNGGVTSGFISGKANNYVKSHIYLEWMTPADGENSSLVIYHGIPVADYTSATGPDPQSEGVLIGSLLYRINGTADDIELILNDDFLGGQRIKHDYPITELAYQQIDSEDSEGIKNITIDLTGITSPIDAGYLIDVFDNNTRPIRAKARAAEVCMITAESAGRRARLIERDSRV